MNISINIAFIVLLIIVNGFFAMSELAVVSSRKARLKTLADRKVPGAQVALELAENPSRFLPTVQIGITLAGIFAGAFGGATLEEPLTAFFEDLSIPASAANAGAIGTMVVCITYVSLVLGELVPKQVALGHPERIATYVALPMRLLAKLTGPVVWILQASTTTVLRVLHIQRVERHTVTEEEIKTIVSEGVAAGVLKPVEKEMIAGVMRLADWRVRAIMTPRQDVEWIDTEESEDQIRHRLRETGFSRVVVARGSLDDVMGLVQAKDVLKRILNGQPLDMRTALCQPVVVHDSMLALLVLDKFRKSPIHMAFVVDERGSFAGVVTATDILKAIVGELAEPVGAESRWTQREDGSWLMDGDLAIDVAKALIDLREIPGEREFQTLAGFILRHLERVPSEGDHFETMGFRFEVMDMDGARIDKVLVIPLPSDTAENQSGSKAVD